jgi:FAD/FMN-containing dehydrogenase
MVTVHAWGRLDAPPHQTESLSDRAQVPAQIARASASRPGLAYGLGRSYGDVCLNPGGLLWKAASLDHFINFDPASGILRCEAGVSLHAIQRLCVPRGWSLPVVPGTQWVTVGGAIANDVHGKNHHGYGSFGDHVRRFTLARTDGSVCEPAPGDPMFAATVGGLGLTGVIVDAELQLKRIPGPWLTVETLPYRDLGEFFELADASASVWEHTVSWIDCLHREGRGIFMRANPAEVDLVAPPPRPERRVPLVPPVSLVNRWSLKPFNALYYTGKGRRATSVQHYESFHHPLDALMDWNRIYGPRGFYQYQCVLPIASGRDGIRALLDRIAAAGMGSFLAVLKTFGQREPVGMLSFAMPGVTLALDFPNEGERTLKLFASLDAIVREAGGRLYPAKDARMPRELFEAGYPRLTEFLPHRDPGISSAMSRRLMGR